MDINQFITEKNINSVIIAITNDINHIPLSYFQLLLEENKKHFSHKNLYNLIETIYSKKNLTQEYQQFILQEADKLFTEVYSKSEKDFNNLIKDGCAQTIFKLILSSNIPKTFKAKYFKNFFKNYYVDGLYEEALKIYEEYDNIHLDDNNYTSWCFDDDSKILKKITKNPKFKKDIENLDDAFKLSLLMIMCKSSNKISLKEFKVLIPSFNSLLEHKDYLNINKLGANEKTFLFYTENSLSLKEVMSNFSFVDYLNFSQKEQEFLIQKLSTENLLFKEKDVIIQIIDDEYSFAYSVDKWKNAKNIIEFSQSKLSQNEQFLKLTKKIINKLEDKNIISKLKDITTELEKNILDEKLSHEVKIATRKMKI